MLTSKDLKEAKDQLERAERIWKEAEGNTMPSGRGEFTIAEEAATSLNAAKVELTYTQSALEDRKRWHLGLG